MRVYELTPPYRRDTVSSYPVYEATDKQRWMLELDEYEIVNLKRLLHAVAQGEDTPIKLFNNGDWVGQIGFYLPETPGNVQPNRSYDA